jgi:hypothetical protein
VVVDGTPFLYFLEARPEDETVSEEALRRRAGQDLMLLKYQEASSRLLSELRKRARVELHPENLPFRYFPEAAS